MSEVTTYKQANREGESEFRCAQCDKLLAKQGIIIPGFEVKCIRCGQLNLIFDDTKELIFFTDSKGIILYANEYVRTLTGYDPHEVLGKTPAVWGGQMPTEFYQDLWQRILSRKEAVAVEVTNKRKDGTLYRALLRISPILDEKGDVQVFFGRQQSLTDREASEAEL